MKQKIVYSFIVMLLVLPALVKAQKPVTPTIYKEWTVFGESKSHYEVSYRIIKCSPNATAQIHLQILNEKDSRTANFEIEIISEDGSKVSKNVHVYMPDSAFMKADCNSEDKSLDALKIDLPSTSNPSALTIKIHFKS